VSKRTLIWAYHASKY